MTVRPLLVPAVLAAMAGCGRDIDPPRPARDTIAVETFAAVLADLAMARAELLPDTVAYRRQRDAILARRGVTAEQVREFGEAYGGNEEVMTRVYRRVRSRIDEQFGSDATVPPSTGVAPPVESQQVAPAVPPPSVPTPADTSPGP